MTQHVTANIKKLESPSEIAHYPEKIWHLMTYDAIKSWAAYTLEATQDPAYLPYLRMGMDGKQLVALSFHCTSPSPKVRNFMAPVLINLLKRAAGTYDVERFERARASEPAQEATV